MPTQRPRPGPFEPEWLDHSLDRYLTWGLVFMVALVVGFLAYRLREPDLRRTALKEQTTSYIDLGDQLFATSCASCHGKGAIGGSGPVLNSKEFLGETIDAQIQLLIAGGVAGSDMPAWSQDFGGTMTDEQVRQIVTYLRSLQPDAPSVPDWRNGRPPSG
jgi:mono/diheme cytochrome c family protein